MVEIRPFGKVVLTAQNGVSRRVSVPISGKVKIGSDPDCDVRVLDPGVDGHCLTLSVGALSIRVIPQSSDVSIDAVACEQPVRIWRNTSRDINLNFGTIRTQLSISKSTYQWRWPLALLAVSVMGVALLFNLRHRESEQVADIHQDIAEETEQQLDEAMLNAQIRQELERLNLFDVLTYDVRIEGNSPVLTTISGNVLDASMQRYRSFLIWYDQIGGAPPLLSNVSIVEPDENPLPQIRMIQMTPEMAIIDGQGTALVSGDFFPDGWKVDNISPEFFTLSRGDDVKIIEIERPKQSEDGGVAE